MKYGVQISCFGHAGDGNLHARIISDPQWSNEKWKALLPQILKELYSLTAELGGEEYPANTVSAISGKKYMHCVVSENYPNMLRAIKQALDPNNVLNPGKIFDLR